MGKYSIAGGRRHSIFEFFSGIWPLRVWPLPPPLPWRPSFSKANMSSCGCHFTKLHHRFDFDECLFVLSKHNLSEKERLKCYAGAKMLLRRGCSTLKITPKYCKPSTCTNEIAKSSYISTWNMSHFLPKWRRQAILLWFVFRILEFRSKWKARIVISIDKKSYFDFWIFLTALALTPSPL